MAGRTFGYSRCSTSTQDWAIELDALIKAGVDNRDIFRETASGVKRDRTELRRVLDLLRGDDWLSSKPTPSLIRQMMLAHNDPADTVPETCRIFGISKSSSCTPVFGQDSGKLWRQDLDAVSTASHT
jgi:hypothetical protein